MMKQFDGVCPCGTMKSYQSCCGVYHAGEPAPTAVALMRSRYSAFALGNEAYLRHSWVAAYCPEDALIDASVKWGGLTIVSAKEGAMGDETGEVIFIARYKVNGRAYRLQERSYFVREAGRWCYLNGDVDGE